MHRLEIHVTDEQLAKIREIAGRSGVSEAEVIRNAMEAGLRTEKMEAEARAAIMATAGILSGAPDWPKWRVEVRGPLLRRTCGRED